MKKSARGLRILGSQRSIALTGINETSAAPRRAKVSSKDRAVSLPGHPPGEVFEKAAALSIPNQQSGVKIVPFLKTKSGI
jgi:hypothetical protein